MRLRTWAILSMLSLGGALLKYWQHQEPLSLAPPPSSEFAGRVAGAGAILDSIFTVLEAHIEPGVTTLQLNGLVRKEIESRGIASSFLGDNGYPAYITASVNEQVINVVPNAKPLREGDLLKLQVGIEADGARVYQAWTYPVGKLRPADFALYDAGIEALEAGRQAVAAGQPVEKVSSMMAGPLMSAGVSPSQDYTGHAIGEAGRIEPKIPCDPHIRGLERHYEAVLRKSDLLSLSVIAHARSPELVFEPDGSIRSLDGARSVHFSAIVMVGSRSDWLMPPRPRVW